jgi:hypothetical protein
MRRLKCTSIGPVAPVSFSVAVTGSVTIGVRPGNGA